MALDVQHLIEVLFDGVGGAALITFFTEWRARNRERMGTVQSYPEGATRRTLWMAVAAVFFVVCLSSVIAIHALRKAPTVSTETGPAPPLAHQSPTVVPSPNERSRGGKPLSAKSPDEKPPNAKSLSAESPSRRATTEDEIRAIIVQQLQVNEAQVTPNADFLLDLGADPLDKAEVIMQIEVEYGIQVPDEDVRKLKTVGDLINYVERKERTGKTPHPQQ